jgi:catechol-2,3-dioxygenase
MARIVHIALKVDDLEKATEFYEKGFGFVGWKPARCAITPHVILPTERSTWL